MKTRCLATLLTAAALTLPALPILANEVGQPASRAEVKDEARKIHTPPGERGQTPRAEPRSNKTTQQRRDETLAARKDGQLTGAGQQGVKPAPEPASTLTSQQRKMDTAAALKTDGRPKIGEIVDRK